MLKAIGNKRIQKIMLGNKGRQEYVARGYNLFYREFIKQATGTDIALTDSKRDTGKITRVEFASNQVVTVQGKNLFDTLKSETWYTNTTLVSRDNNQITISCTPGQWRFVQLTRYLKAGTYVLQRKYAVTSGTPVNVTTGNVNIYNNDLSVYYASILNNSNNVSFTVTNAGNYQFIFYISADIANVDNMTIKFYDIQLEQGSTATAYTPFVPNSPSPDYISPVVSSADNGLTIRSSSATGTSDKVITLPTGFVGGKLPNGTMDTLEPISNVMNAVQRMGKKTFNGSEPGWFQWETQPNTLSFALPKANFTNNFKYSSLSNTCCNSFITTIDIDPSTVYSVDVEKYALNPDDTFCVQFRINKSRLTTQDVAGFKTWLASNNVTVYYELATPVYTPISDIKIDTYPNNTITSLSSVKPNMTVKYLEK